MYKEFSKYSDLIFHVCIISVLLNIFALVFSLFVIIVYDKVIGSKQLSLLYAITSAVLVLMIFDFVAKRLKSELVGKIRSRFELGFGDELSNTIFSGKVMSHEVKKRLSGCLQSKAQIADFLSTAVPIILVDFPFVIVFLSIIYFIAPDLFFIPLIAVFFLFFVMFIMGSQRGSSIEHYNNSSHNFQAFYSSLLGAQNLIQFWPGNWKIQKKWRALKNNEVRASTIMLSKNYLIIDLIQLISQACQIGIVFWGTLLFFENKITFGILFASVILTGRAFSPLAGIARIVSNWPQLLNSKMDLQAVKHQEIFEKKAVKLTNFNFSVTDLCLTYDQANMPALQGIVLDIQNGEKVGLVGPPSSGKSSVLNCLAGRLAPSKGNITLGGIKLIEIPPSQLGTTVSLIDQFPTFFPGTVRENIDFGLFDNDSAEIDLIFEKFEHYMLFDILKNTLNRSISSDGRELTGGERKLLATMRALIIKPKILLLDEPTNSFDTESEKKFVALIKQEFVNSTVVVASHRIEALSFVDKLYIMREGNIVAGGPLSKFLTLPKHTEEKINS